MKRIACLEPSATAICLELGLANDIVGITHECRPVIDLYYGGTSSTGNGEGGGRERLRQRPSGTNYIILTKNGLTVNEQGDIHQAILDVSAAAVEKLNQHKQQHQHEAFVCPRPSSSSSNNEGEDTNDHHHHHHQHQQPEPVVTAEDIPTLYPLVHEALAEARPTVIFTQDLCQVCAPTTSDVQRCLLKIRKSKNNNGDGGRNHEKDDNDDNDGIDGDESTPVQIVALQPTTLEEVIETFGTVATVCGVPDRGVDLQNQFKDKLRTIKHTIETNRDHQLPKPRLMILEWLDPPFDSGHWTFEMMEYACVDAARHEPKLTHKAKEISWDNVKSANPDVVVVGCCGFDLERNIRDTKKLAARHLKELPVGKTGRVYASNGDLYIAQPSPSLLQGVVLLAQCAYQSQPKVLHALADLQYESVGWKQVDMTGDGSLNNVSQERTSVVPLDSCVGDIEDSVVDGAGWAKIHDEACKEGKLTYEDPETGYSVFTAVAHKNRGKCCGSGCRHCPYSHENVRDRSSKIQQPAVLYRATTTDGQLFSIDSNSDIKVLFFSGGKDSFLTIRKLVREHQSSKAFGLVLLTTFDATTRIIAHQEVKVDEVVKQASHLNITLLGVPLRRGSGETYTDRVRAGLSVIRSIIPSTAKLSSLVFGDLHLSHIKEWRDKILIDFDCELEYPLWLTPYSQLMDDLEASQVPCQISGSTCDKVAVSTMFDRKLYSCLSGTDIDQFGEKGEFHSLAKVWEVSRSTALGLNR